MSHIDALARTNIDGLTEALDVPWAVLDTELRYVDHDCRWAARYHVGDEALVGRLHWDLFPDSQARWRQIFARCLAGASHFGDHEPFRRRDGETMWLRWAVLPRVADDRVEGLLLIADPHDVADVGELLPAAGLADGPCGFAADVSWIRTGAGYPSIERTSDLPTFADALGEPTTAEVAHFFAHRLANPLQGLASHVWLADEDLLDGDQESCRDSLAEIEKLVTRLGGVVADLRLLATPAAGAREPVDALSSVALAIAVERAAIGDETRGFPHTDVTNGVDTRLEVVADEEALVGVIATMIAEVAAVSTGAPVVRSRCRGVRGARVELTVHDGVLEPDESLRPELLGNAGARTVALRISAHRAAMFGARLLAPRTGPVRATILCLDSVPCDHATGGADD